MFSNVVHRDVAVFFRVQNKPLSNLAGQFANVTRPRVVLESADCLPGNSRYRFIVAPRIV